ncbi:alpha/beta hydrolase family protein [Maritalea sp.]|uniref:alpha/beta hydrolase family protein n=1 Tax=Maritalea sp. TaxID=2003361 RepID=UPI003EF37AC8
MKRIWFVAIPVFLIVIAFIAASSVLSPELPSPSGKHQVGYQRLTIAKGERWVDAQVFYPASSPTNMQPVAMPQDLAEQLSKSFGIPTIAMTDERALLAYTDAPVAPGKHPALIFNHGHGMYATQNSHNILELASQGYIIFALNHPGHSLLSKNGQQTVTKNDDVSNYTEEEAKTLLTRQALGNDQLRATTSLDEWKTKMEVIQQEAFADIVDQFPVWIENNKLMLDALPELNNGEQQSQLANAIDLAKVGYFGHSFGGAVATHMGMNDSRVKAAFNLDGPVFRWSLSDNPTASFCFAYGDSNNQAGVRSDFSWANQQVAIATNGCEYVFQGAAHMNFSDLNEITILKWFGQLGPIGAKLMRENLNQSLLQFFNQHLRDQTESLKLSGTQMKQH